MFLYFISYTWVIHLYPWLWHQLGWLTRAEFYSALTHFKGPESVFMYHLISFHNYIMIYLVLIIIFIMVLLYYMFRYSIYGFMGYNKNLSNFIYSINYLEIKIYRIYLFYYLLSFIISIVQFLEISYYMKWHIEDSKFSFDTISNLIFNKSFSLILLVKYIHRFIFENLPLIFLIYNKLCFVLVSFIYFIFGINLPKETKLNLSLFDSQADILKVIKNYSEDDFILWSNNCLFDHITLSDIEYFVYSRYVSEVLFTSDLVNIFYWTSFTRSLRHYISTNKLGDESALLSMVEILKPSYIPFWKKIREPECIIEIYSNNFNSPYSLWKSSFYVSNWKFELLLALIPTIFLIEILFPSLALLKLADPMSYNAEHVVKIQGSQWFWTYELMNDINILLILNCISYFSC